MKNELYEVLKEISSIQNYPKDKGNYLTIECPKCRKPEAYLYKDSVHFIKCNRDNKCGAVSETGKYLENHNVDSKLISFLLDLSDSYSFRKEAMLEEILRLSRFLLKYLSIKRKSDLMEFLKTRNYTLDDIIQMGIGYIDSFQDMKNYLIEKGIFYEKDFTNLFPKRIKNKKYSLVIPVFNKDNKLISFILRTIAEDKPKYLFEKGFRRAELLLHHENCNISEKKTLIITEGVLDPLIAYTKGIDNIVGIGSSTITDSQIKIILKNFNVKKIIIFLDNDNAGIKGTFRSVTKILSYIRFSKENIKVKIVDYSSNKKLENHKDLDSYLAGEILNNEEMNFDKSSMNLRKYTKNCYLQFGEKEFIGKMFYNLSEEDKTYFLKCFKKEIKKEISDVDEEPDFMMIYDLSMDKPKIIRIIDHFETYFDSRLSNFKNNILLFEDVINTIDCNYNYNKSYLLAKSEKIGKYIESLIYKHHLIKWYYNDLKSLRISIRRYIILDDLWECEFPQNEEPNIRVMNDIRYAQYGISKPIQLDTERIFCRIYGVENKIYQQEISVKRNNRVQIYSCYSKDINDLICKLKKMGWEVNK